MVQITDTAKGKIQEVLSQNQGKYVRLYFQGMGWSGPKIGMALDEPLVDEKPVQVNDIGFLIADEAEPWVDEMTIDYVKDPYREGFTIKGPAEDCC